VPGRAPVTARAKARAQVSAQATERGQERAPVARVQERVAMARGRVQARVGVPHRPAAHRLHRRRHRRR